MVVHNFFAQIASHLKKSPNDIISIDSGERAAHGLWKCEVEVKWPDEQSFSYSSTSKVDACNMACLQLLGYLQVSVYNKY